MHGWRRTLVVLCLGPSVLQGQPLFALLIRFVEQVLRHEQEILDERKAKTIIRVWTIKKLLLTIHKFCHLYNIEGTYRYGTLQLTRGHNSNSWWSRWIKCIVNWLKTTSRGANLTKKSEKPTDLPQIQYSRQLVASACTAQISHMRRSWHSSFKVN